MQNKVFVVKRLSETMWSASSSASKALALNYFEVVQTLRDIALSEVYQIDSGQWQNMRQCDVLVNKLESLDTALMCIIWNDVLQKINLVSKALQEAGIKICTVVKLYNSLLTNFREIRDQFDDYEEKAKRLVPEGSDYAQSGARKRFNFHLKR